VTAQCISIPINLDPFTEKPWRLELRRWGGPLSFCRLRPKSLRGFNSSNTRRRRHPTHSGMSYFASIGDKMSKSGTALLFIGFISMAFTSSGYAGIIFSENYDAIQSGWNCSDTLPSGWPSEAACGSDTYDGTTHYYGEITSGGRTGNSLKLWRHNGGFSEYGGYLGKDLTEAEFNNHYTNLHFRWYIKFPVGWDCNQSSAHTHKLSRLNTATTYGGNPYSTLYFDVKGDISFSGGRFTLYDTQEGGVYYSEKTVAEYGVIDGNWHCYEIWFKLNSGTGVGDGELHLYLDGVEVGFKIYGQQGPLLMGFSNYDLGYPSGVYFSRFMPPAIGNLTEGTWNFPTNTWYAVEFDDYIVSTERIGCHKQLAAPNAPKNIRVE